MTKPSTTLVHRVSNVSVPRCQGAFEMMSTGLKVRAEWALDEVLRPKATKVKSPMTT